MNGVLNAFKPKGPTSHDVVDEVRKKTGERRVGHAGTLDPFARGVLILGVGRRATRILEFLKGREKVYWVKMRLGIVTETFDVTGNVVEENECDVSGDIVKKVVESFVGEYLQVPPAYSAKRYKGKRLYELAREGKIIRLPPKKVRIYDVWDLKVNLPFVSFRVRTSPGTYVRSLSMDIGYKLGCGAVVMELVREAVGEFKVEDSLNPFEAPREEIEANLIPIEMVLRDLPAIVVGRKSLKKILSGSHPKLSDVERILGSFEKGRVIKLLNGDGKIVALATSERSSNFLRTLKRLERNERIAKIEKVLGE